MAEEVKDEMVSVKSEENSSESNGGARFDEKLGES